MVEPIKTSEEEAEALKGSRRDWSAKGKEETQKERKQEGITMRKLGGKKILTGALAAAMTAGSLMTVLAAPGWNQNAIGWWWENTDGSYVVNNWVQDAGKWYFMDGNGYMSRGWIWDNGTWYFADASGAMLRGWVRVDGAVYYLNPVSDGTQGAMAVGMRTIDGVDYIFDESGACMSSRNQVEIPAYNGNGTVAAEPVEAHASRPSGGGSSSSDEVTEDVKELNNKVNAAAEEAIGDAQASGDLSATAEEAPIRSIDVESGVNTDTKTIAVSLREEPAAEATLADVSGSFAPQAQAVIDDADVVALTYNGKTISKETAQSMLDAAKANDVKTLDTLAGKSYTVKVEMADGGEVTYTFTFRY